MSASLGRRLLRAALPLAVAALTSALVPAPAQAQLLKKIKEKAAEKVVDKAADKAGITQSGSAVGDLSTLGAPITADTLELLMKGLRIAEEKLAQRETANTEWSAAQSRLSQMTDANAPAVESWRDRAGKIEECQHDYQRAVATKREQEMQAKAMSNPMQFNGVMQQYAMRIADLQRKGDTAGVWKAQMELYKKLLGVDPAADSAAARARCGTVPPKPAALVEQEKLEQQVAELAGRVRTLETQAVDAGAATSGMTTRRYHLARERLYLWYSKTQGGKQDVKWPAEEEALFKPKAGELKGLMRALQ